MQTIFTQLYGSKYSYLIQIIFKQIYLTIDKTLTGTKTLGPSEFGSNGNEKESQYFPDLLSHNQLWFSVLVRIWCFPESFLSLPQRIQTPTNCNTS